MPGLTRREWLRLAATNAAAALIAWPARSAARPAVDRAALERRITRLIDEFERQGHHRTGTAVDRASAEWLSHEVEQAGLTPSLEAFALSRVDPIEAALRAGERRIAGIPLFDGAFTDARGVRGRLGPLGSDAPIGLTEAAPNTAGAGALGDARRRHRHAALVVVTRGGRPGLCPSNADLFLQPFGPPVLQVSSEESSTLADLARRGEEVHLVAYASRTPATAFNVTARIAGTLTARPPLIVMTPRSGWYACASERGGGIAAWLELMRALHAERPARDVQFVASSGHELGHLGINAYVDARPGIVSTSAGWMHFGANIGAATDPGNTVQASDDDFEAMLADAIIAAGLRVDRRNPRGTVPGGEAEVVHRGGGRYMSLIGRSALFHNPDDRGPGAVDPGAVARFVEAATTIARALSGP
jgi:hypothetical protein